MRQARDNRELKTCDHVCATNCYEQAALRVFLNSLESDLINGRPGLACILSRRSQLIVYEKTNN
jgi:hypothetical protein